MRHYCFVGDDQDILGVWVADDEIAAARLQLNLELMYPDCETVVRKSSSYESLKQDLGHLEWGDLEPDILSV